MDFINSISTIENVNFSKPTTTLDEDLFKEDVIDENDIDNWTIDDLFGAIPKTLECFGEHICSFHLWYNKEMNMWNCSYDTDWGDHCYANHHEDLFECLKLLYTEINE